MPETDGDIFFWMVALRELMPGEHSAYIAITTPESIKAGREPTTTRTMCPRELILGRPTVSTDAEMDQFNAAHQASPDVDIEEWFSFLKPSNVQVVAFAEKFNANLLRLTDEEISFVYEILPLVRGPHPVIEAMEILAAWRWGQPMNIAYEDYFPEKVVALKRGRAPLVPPFVGAMLLTCGEVKAMAVDRVPDTGMLRVVTLEDSDCLWKTGLHFEIFQYSLFEIDECLFRQAV
jgi:hypothetical protein